VWISSDACGHSLGSEASNGTMSRRIGSLQPSRTRAQKRPRSPILPISGHHFAWKSIHCGSSLQRALVQMGGLKHANAKVSKVAIEDDGYSSRQGRTDSIGPDQAYRSATTKEADCTTRSEKVQNECA